MTADEPTVDQPTMVTAMLVRVLDIRMDDTARCSTWSTASRNRTCRRGARSGRCRFHITSLIGRGG